MGFMNSLRALTAMRKSATAPPTCTRIHHAAITMSSKNVTANKRVFTHP